MNTDWPIPELLDPPVVVEPGARLARAGARVTKLHLITGGVVGRFVRLDDGEILDAIRSSGWVLGAVPAMTSGIYEAGLEAITPCTLRTVSVSAFVKARLRPELACWIAQMFADDLAADAARKATIARGGLRAVVEHFLAELFRSVGRPADSGLVKLTIPVKPADLSRLFRVSREHASRILADLEGDRFIVRDKGWTYAPALSPILRDCKHPSSRDVTSHVMSSHKHAP